MKVAFSLPGALVVRFFLIGMIFTLPGSLVQWMIIRFFAVLGINHQPAIQSFIFTAFPEEIAKMNAIWIIKNSLERHNGSAGTIKLLFSTFIMSIGFALIENIFYLLNSHSPMSSVVIRSLTTLPLHILSSGIIALGFGGKFKFMLGLLPAVCVHGFYNLILNHPVMNWGIVFLFLFLGWIGFLFFLYTLHNKKSG